MGAKKNFVLDTLARGAEILGIKLDDMRDLAESWAS